MANPKGIGGRKFQKGQSGNPGGGRKVDPEIRQFKETTYAEFIEKLQLFGSMTPVEMKAYIEDPKAKMFDVIFGRILYDASKGEKDARQVLLERLWGKVKDQVIHSMDESERDRIRKLTMVELTELVKGNITDGKT